MKAKHADIVITESNPFENCKLEREPFADILTGIVQNYAEGFVLAINNEWGTGKTTFVKMWQQKLENNHFKTLYFNAWENDFDSKPLIAIMSEFKSLATSKTKADFKSLLQKGAAISKAVIPSLAKAIADRYIDTESITDAIKEASQASLDILTEEVEEHSKKKESLEAFRKELTKYIKKATNDDKPLVFIIDELDRCRPNYAVEVLEQIKHLFSVKGIVFVLSIDKEQLGHAVRGVYGSERINADEYLRRFIDIEYSIPEPKTELFCEYLFHYFELFQYYNHPKRKQDHSEDKSLLIKSSSYIFNRFNCPLRVQEKIYSHLRLIVSSISLDLESFPQIFFLLIFIKHTDNALYHEIRNKKIGVQQLFDKLMSNYIGENNKHGDVTLIARSIAILTFFYSNNYYYPKYESLIIKKGEEKETNLRIEIKYDAFAESIRETIIGFSSHYYYYHINLKPTFDRIDLLVQSLN